MSDVPEYRFVDNDEVDLLAIRRVLHEAELRVIEHVEDLEHKDAQRDVDRHTDRRASDHLGRLAAEACWRFEGEKRITSTYRQAKERRYAMYAMHPDTAEQMLKAIEFLIERQGPRLRFHTRPTRMEPKTVRNAKPGSVLSEATDGQDD